MSTEKNKFYETWWFWLIVGFVIIMSVGMITLEGGDKRVEKNEEAIEETTEEFIPDEIDYAITGQEEYPQVMEDNYMEGCMVSEGTEDYCHCTWNYLTDEMTMEEFIDMSFELDKTREMPDVMNRAINECFHKLEY